MTPAERYPALIAYILDRSTNYPTPGKWCDKLREDQAEASTGGLADVATQLAQAQADFGRYPYNRDMGTFLALPSKPGSDGDPVHGYYMAARVLDAYRLGEATRAAESLIRAGRPLRVAVAKDRKTGKPLRFATFVGPDQIRIDGNRVTLANGKRRGSLASNWSLETAIVKLAAALRTGLPYGEREAEGREAPASSRSGAQRNKATRAAP